MLSHTRRPRPRAWSNQSDSEKDFSQSLRRRSVQSINNFSFRRLLGNESLGHPFRSASFTEATNAPDGIRTRDRYDTHQCSPTRNNSITSQPLAKGRRSYHNHKDQAAQDLKFLPTADSCNRSPLSRVESESHPNAEKLSDTLSPSLSATELLLRPLFSRKSYQSHIMGNKASALSRSARLEENQPLQAQPDTEKSLNRPVSSPLPVPSEKSSFKVVIPDRHSSITPRLADSSSTDYQKIENHPAETSHSQSSSSTETASNQALLRGHTSIPPSSLNIKTPTITDLPSAPSLKPLSPRVSTNTFRPLVPLLTLTLPTPAPPLTPIHLACYQSHRHMHFSNNIHNPVPCMTCGNEGGTTRWKCQWCCLRICRTCMEVLGRAAGRDLNVLVKRLEETGRGLVGGRLEDWGEKVQRAWKSGREKG